MKRIDLKLKARCSRCRRILPFTNPKAACAAMRRHRNKYHPTLRGKLRYKVLYPCQEKGCDAIFPDDGARLDHLIDEHWPQQPAPKRRKK